MNVFYAWKIVYFYISCQLYQENTNEFQSVPLSIVSNVDFPWNASGPEYYEPDSIIQWTTISDLLRFPNRNVLIARPSIQYSNHEMCHIECDTSGKIMWKREKLNLFTCWMDKEPSIRPMNTEWLFSFGARCWGKKENSIAVAHCLFVRLFPCVCMCVYAHMNVFIKKCACVWVLWHHGMDEKEKQPQ